MLTPTLNLPTITQEFALNTIRANRAFGQIESKIVALGTRLSNLGIAVSLAISIPMQIAGAAIIKTAIDLDQVVTQAFAKIEGAGLGVKDALSNAASAISMITATPAVDLAGGMKELIASGYSAADAIKAVGIVERFATAGELELNQASSTLISTMAALGLRTGNTTEDMRQMVRVSDVLTKAADMTRVGVEDFATALTHKGLIALRLANKSLEEGVAVLAMFAQQGIEGSRAGEYLYRSMRDIETTALKHAGIWSRIGISVHDVNGNLRALPDIIGNLEQRLAGANEQQARQLLMMLKLPDRSLAATLALLGFSREIAHYQQVLENAEGTTERVWNIQMKSFANQFAITKNQVIAMGKDIATLLIPTLLYLGLQVQRLVGWWFSLSEAQKSSYVAWGLVLAGIGPVILAVGLATSMFGQLITVIISLGKWLTVVTAKTMIFAATQLIAMGWVGVLIGGIGLLIAVLVGQQGLTWAFEQIGKGIAFAFGEIESQISRALDSAHRKVEEIMRNSKTQFGGMIPEGATEGKDMTNFFKSEFKNFENALMGDFDESLLIAPEKEKKLKDRGAMDVKGFSAQELGSEEEYRLRVAGSAALVKSTDKLLAEQKKTTGNTGSMAQTLLQMKGIMERNQQNKTTELGLA